MPKLEPNPAGVELDCPQLVEWVTEYLEGALQNGHRAAFEDHLTICPGCVTYLDQMRITIRALGHVDLGGASPAVQRGLMNAFRAAQAEQNL